MNVYVSTESIIVKKKLKISLAISNGEFAEFDEIEILPKRVEELEPLSSVWKVLDNKGEEYYILYIPSFCKKTFLGITNELPEREKILTVGLVVVTNINGEIFRTVKLYSYVTAMNIYPIEAGLYLVYGRTGGVYEKILMIFKNNS